MLSSVFDYALNYFGRLLCTELALGLVGIPTFRFCCVSALITELLSPPPYTTAPSGAMPPHCRGFTITLRHTTLGRTPLDG